MGDTYHSSSGNYTEYDPESPRPTGLFPPERGQQRGFGDLGAPPPPPPPPTMNLPGRSMAFGASRIPGPPIDAGPPPSGIAPPLWPPSRMPVTSKPPVGSLAVSRTSSVQSEGWTNRGSIDRPTMDQHEADVVETVPENDLGPPPMMMQHQDQHVQETYNGFSNIDARPPLEAVTNSAMKKPPPAIAKESPLKALYAKGAENYDGSRRRINLKLTLDSVADHGGPKEGGFQQMAAPFPHATGYHSVEQRTSIDEPAQHAPEPAFFPVQQQSGSNQGSSQSLFADDREKRNVFNPMNPPQSTEVQYPQQEAHDYAPAVDPVGKMKVKKKRFLKKRFVLSQCLFLTCLIFNPSWTLTRVTVAGAVIQSGLAGYAMIDREEYSTMLHSQFHKDTSMYEYIGLIEGSFDLVHGASESAWGTAVNRLQCESSRSVCHWARNVIHSLITTGVVAQKTTIVTYKNIPHALHAGKAWMSSIASGEFWAMDEANLKSWFVEKALQVKSNGLGLSRSTLDFAVCSARTCLKSGNMMYLSRNVLLCCMSSYEDFLKGEHVEDMVPSTNTSGGEEEQSVAPEFEQPLTPEFEQPLPEFEQDEDHYVHHMNHSDIEYDRDQYKSADSYQVEEPLPPPETKEDVSSDLPVAHEDTMADVYSKYNNEEKDEVGIDEHASVPPLDEFATQEEHKLEIPAATLDDQEPVDDNITIPEYLDEPESPDDKIARARRRLEKEKVLAGRKKRREAEKTHRSMDKGDDVPTNEGQDIPPGDVRSILSNDPSMDQEGSETEELAQTAPVSHIQIAFAKAFAQAQCTLSVGLSKAVEIIRANVTHIVTALSSALVASLLFIIQGTRRRTGQIAEERVDVSTPRFAGARESHDEEPATVYKSAEPAEKKTSRRRTSRARTSEEGERPRQRSKTPKAKRSTKATTLMCEEEEQPTRRSTRTRSTSRKSR